MNGKEYDKNNIKALKCDTVVVGTGAAGLFCALHLPADSKVILITKDVLENSDSYLAQGGICMLRSEDDYEPYFADTLKAGHYENDRESVDIMIRSSQDVIKDLVKYGVRFEKQGEEFAFTREGAHSKPRILYYKDITGKEITSKLLEEAKARDNLEMMEYTTMLDILEEDRCCKGIICKDRAGQLLLIEAENTVLACGGIGGLYEHSTNFAHLTGDGIAVALKHKVALKDINYVQIHPTTFYSEKPGRSFLISESVRGEGAVLLDRDGNRFTDELQPRDVVTKAILEKMKEEGTPYVRLDMTALGEETIMSHFPNIYKHCLEEGYDVTREPIPVVPAQHYLMGGIDVDKSSKTEMDNLYAIGETSCNGVHGANRLASNSLLEGLVFAKRAARDIERNSGKAAKKEWNLDFSQLDERLESYRNFGQIALRYKDSILKEIERMKNESNNAKANC